MTLKHLQEQYALAGYRVKPYNHPLFPDKKFRVSSPSGAKYFVRYTSDLIALAKTLGVPLTFPKKETFPELQESLALKGWKLTRVIHRLPRKAEYVLVSPSGETTRNRSLKQINSLPP
jgi:hypothetical protein